jgi:hypothetical protein
MESTSQVTLPVAALELGVSWGVAWRLALRGELEASKIGGRWMVTRRSVERLQRKREPVTAA